MSGIMKNKIFTIPAGEPEKISNNGSDDLLSLRNRSSGKRLFRQDYFNLLNGDFSVLLSNPNKWFLQEILVAGSNGDINLIPALKKIASDQRFDETIQHRSAEITEVLQAHSKIPVIHDSVSASQTEEERLMDARKSLAGIRIPQTTEILRLLREKSVESKRLGIFIIGKFRLTDMLPEVCECLNVPGMENDTVAVLKASGDSAANELRLFYLKTSGNISVCKIILRLLSTFDSYDDNNFIIERLWSNSRQIKEVALDCLVKKNFRAPDEYKNRLHHLIYEIAGTLTYLISTKICFRQNNNEFLYREVNKEYLRWKSFLANLLLITNPSGDIAAVNNGKRNILNEMNNAVVRLIPGLAEIIFSEPGTHSDDLKFEVKRLRKLQPFFPRKALGYMEAIDDLINLDYNLAGVWLKACALRSLPGTGNTSLLDSVIALLFSQESILQEEALRLVSRSGSELYKSVSERLSDQSRTKLDKINSTDFDEKELIFEKTKFLSSGLPEIPENDLLFLAANMKYIKPGMDIPMKLPDGSIIWNILSGKPDPQIIILNNEDLDRDDKKIFDADSIGCYILERDVVDGFNRLYPERGFEIFKFIDENEE